MAAWIFSTQKIQAAIKGDEGIISCVELRRRIAQRKAGLMQLRDRRLSLFRRFPAIEDAALTLWLLEPAQPIGERASRDRLSLFQRLGPGERVAIDA